VAWGSAFRRTPGRGAAVAPALGAVALVLVVLGAVAVGSGSYAPRIDPRRFTTTVDNPYFDLIPGARRVYRVVGPEGGTRLAAVEVTAATREIMGVTCVVVRRTVTADGRVVEHGVSWYAQDADGAVWYFGAQTARAPAAGHPRPDGSLLAGASWTADASWLSEGSWTAGVAGAQPGVVMLAKPQVGRQYREEYRPGVAEDSADVESVDARARVPVGTFVGTLRIRDATPLGAGRVERRYYAEGVGLVLIVTVRPAGTRTELMELTRGEGG
jgi:hypothetical protein